MDIKGALSMAVLPSVLALVMTAVFDATGTIRAVAGQAGQIDENGRIINGGRALTADSRQLDLLGLPRRCAGGGLHRIDGRRGGGREDGPGGGGGRRAVPRW